MVYQFSLPPLLLHAMQFGTTRYLAEWARNLPAPPPGCTFLNFTASHDGIGVRPLEGLVPPEEIQALVERVRQLGGLVSSRRLPDGGESPYELNITYFDAMGDPVVHDPDLHIRRFLCSQTIQMALQGIPAIYFHSLTASHNDYFGVNQTGQNRSINRGRWAESQLEDLLADGSSVTARVFHEYTRRLQLRAAKPAFHPDVPQRVLELEDGLFGIERRSEAQRLLCISNLTGRPAQVSPAALPEPGDGPWVELLSGRNLKRLPDRLRLEPYETLWLSSGGG
jgi:sucrose phosphorylase